MKRQFCIEVFRDAAGKHLVFVGEHHLWLKRALSPQTRLLARFEDESYQIHLYANYDAPEDFCKSLVGHVIATHDNPRSAFEL